MEIYAGCVPSAHLVHFVPLRVDSFMDDFAPEELRPDLNDSIRVRLAFDQPSQELVLTQQVLGLDEMDPQNALRGDKGTTVCEMTFHGDNGSESFLPKKSS